MYRGTLIAVADMEKSREFYCDLLGMEVEADFGASVQLAGGLTLQSLASWQTFIQNRKITKEHNASELYFEVQDIDAFYEKLKAADICFVHGLTEHDWGQRACRFYDPDRHMIEVAEDIAAVVKRFYDSGMREIEVAERMDVPLEFVWKCLEN